MGIFILSFVTVWYLYYPQVPHFFHPIKRLQRRFILRPAPDFPAQIEWFNSSTSPKLKDFSGRNLLIYFWRGSCIDCLEDLRYLEQIQSNNLAVLTVHSPKFREEHSLDLLRGVINRYQISLPIAADSDSILKGLYQIERRPSFAIIDQDGKIRLIHEGRIDHNELTRFLQQEIPLKHSVQTFQTASTDQLYFPRDVAIDPLTRRLFIADSGHNRIVVTTLTGEILDIVGSGLPGSDNGDFNTARFRDPQGLLWDGSRLLVADRGNHLVRMIDFNKKRVGTLLGTGERRNQRILRGNGPAIALSYPSDLALLEKKLYITMAGAHQIWEVDLKTYKSRVFAGTGMAKTVNAQHARAGLAEPQGIIFDGNDLYFVDSEGSSLRHAATKALGWVRTVVGKSVRDFGDRDGGLSAARLQHPTDLVKVKNEIFLTDTFNQKIKSIDLTDRKIQTFAGSGKSGFVDGRAREAAFQSPEGISFADGRLYVADAFNHAIRVIDLSDGNVSTLNIHQPVQTKSASFSDPLADYLDEEQELSPVSTKFSGIQLEIKFPDGYKFLEDAPSQLTIASRLDDFETNVDIHAISQFIPLEHIFSEGELNLRLDLCYCRDGEEGMCLIRRVSFRLPLKEEMPPQIMQLVYAVPVLVE